MQSGGVLIVLIVALALSAASAFWYESKKIAAKAKTAHIEEVAKRAAEAKAQSELKAFQLHIDAERAKNVHAISIKSAPDLYAKWKDGILVAQHTIGLATRVVTLQALKHETEGLIFLDWLKRGKAKLLQA